MCSVGDWVDCNYRNRGQWFSGKIAAVNNNGSYNVAFDDGDSEKNVTEQRVTYVGPGLDKGARCEIDLSGTGDNWISVTFKKITEDSLAEVIVDEGEGEGEVKRVKKSSLRGVVNFFTPSAEGEEQEQEPLVIETMSMSMGVEAPMPTSPESGERSPERPRSSRGPVPSSSSNRSQSASGASSSPSPSSGPHTPHCVHTDIPSRPNRPNSSRGPSPARPSPARPARGVSADGDSDNKNDKKEKEKEKTGSKAAAAALPQKASSPCPTRNIRNSNNGNNSNNNNNNNLIKLDLEAVRKQIQQTSLQFERASAQVSKEQEMSAALHEEQLKHVQQKNESFVKSMENKHELELSKEHDKLTLECDRRDALLAKEREVFDLDIANLHKKMEKQTVAWEAELRQLHVKQERDMDKEKERVRVDLEKREREVAREREAHERDIESKNAAATKVADKHAQELAATISRYENALEAKNEALKLTVAKEKKRGDLEREKLEKSLERKENELLKKVTKNLSLNQPSPSTKTTKATKASKNNKTPTSSALNPPSSASENVDGRGNTNSNGNEKDVCNDVNDINGPLTPRTVRKLHEAVSDSQQMEGGSGNQEGEGIGKSKEDKEDKEQKEFVNNEELYSLIATSLEIKGMPTSDADIVAGCIMYAEKRGNNQGCIKITSGALDKACCIGIEAGGGVPPIEILHESPVSALLDGKQHVGMSVLSKMTKIAIQKASINMTNGDNNGNGPGCSDGGIGIAIIGARNYDTATGALGYWAREIAMQGLIGELAFPPFPLHTRIRISESSIDHL